MKLLLTFFMIGGLLVSMGCGGSTTKPHKPKVVKSLEQKKKEFKDVLTQKGKDIEEQIKKLEEEAAKAKDDAKKKLEETIKTLREQQKTAQATLAEVDDIAEDKWDKFADDTKDVWDALSQAVDEAVGDDSEPEEPESGDQDPNKP